MLPALACLELFNRFISTLAIQWNKVRGERARTLYSEGVVQGTRIVNHNCTT